MTKLSSRFYWKPIIKIAGITTVNKIINVCIKLLIIPLLINELGVERFGLWITISSLSAYIMLLDFGLGSKSMNDLTRYYSHDDRESADTQIRDSFYFLSFIALICLIFSMLIIQYIDVVALLKLTDPKAKSEVNAALIVASLVYYLQLPFSLILKIPYTMQKGQKAEIALMAGNITSAAGLFLGVYTGMGLPFIVFFLSGSFTFSAIGLFIHLVMSKDIDIHKWNTHELRIKFGVLKGNTPHFIIMQTVAVLLTTLPYSMLALTEGAASVATFGIMLQVLIVLQLPVLVFTQPMWAKLVQLVALKDHYSLIIIIKKYLFITLIYSFFTTLFYLFLLDPMLRVFLNNTITVTIGMKVAFAVWCTCCLFAGGGMGIILLALGETLIISKLSIAQIILFLICAMLLLPSLGAVGLVISIIATYLIALPVMVLTTIRKSLLRLA